MTVRRDVAEAFRDWATRELSTKVWQRGGCSSWYKTERGTNFTLWPGTTLRYRWATRRPHFQDFEYQ
jgi:hypothetical protein